MTTRSAPDICWMGVAEAAAAVRSREISAEELVRAHLDRAAAKDGSVGAFLSRDDDRALARARRIDGLLSNTDPGPLAGVPLAVKDLLDVAGQPTTCGSRILEGYRPPFTATAVARLEAAGAVLVGKTNLDEFAMGSSTENSAYQLTRNPWDGARVPGGSSGGSAAAVAAGFAPMALGTDTGGSVRQPAAFCGVSGLKPTYGRVSRYGVAAFASSLDQVGPIARSAADLALVASALFGHDPQDATSADVPVPDLTGALTGRLDGLTIGVPWSFLGEGVDPAVAASFREALRVLEDAGARTVEITLPHLPHAIATYYIVATAEASSNLARYDGVRYGLRAPAAELAAMYGETRDRGFGPEVKRRILLGTFVLSSGYYDAYYLRAQKVRTLIRRDFERALDGCDVVATPTAPTLPFRIGEKTADPLQMYLADIFTVPASLAGIPGLSVPSAPVEGLPVGLQLLGRPWGEADLLRAGHALQERTGFHRLRPPV
jgi:aspartyl-tRNA(Asn)/glutamyl-tRNA(Gln) amidotransferase subunit A